MSTQDKPAGPTPGHYRKPHQLRTDTIDLDGTIYKFVDFIADLTFGWGTRWVILSQDEIISGKRRQSGEHMPDLRSGLKEKKSIKKAIDAALEAGLIEVRYTRWGTAYAIHRRYWGLMPFAPRWEIFGFIYHDPETDPLPDVSPGGLNPPTDDVNAQIDAATGVWNPPGNTTESTSQYYSTHQPIISKQPAESRGAAPEEARDERKDTSLNTSKRETEDRYVAPSARSPSARLISVSKTEKEENEAPPAPEFPNREQAPLQAKEDSKSNATSLGRKEAPAPARTADVEAARRRQHEAIDARRQAQEVERKAKLEAERIASAAKEVEQRAVGKFQERYNALVLAKQKTAPGSPAWQQAQEELQEVKHQLAAHGWYL